MRERILITGGAGFIGSHTCIALVTAGYAPVVLDNLSNSDARVMSRLATLTGTPIELIEGDVRDRTLLNRVFSEHSIAGVIHFAGLKAVGDSVADPLLYYDNNVVGTLVLASAMEAAGVSTLIFSSSATVYGEPESSPIPETAPCRPASPYGHSKRMVEQILSDLLVAHPEWRLAVLRYFNPVGAHESGLIGEHPQGKPNNLMPYVAQVAMGLRERLAVHGGDYPTPDGTGVRDYVHVMDLAEGHVAALEHAARAPGLVTLNLGTGQGASVLQVVDAFERASGRPIVYDVGPRRAGDVPAYWGDPSLAQTTLGWRARRTLQQMCEDSWRWQRENSNGYADASPIELPESGPMPPVLVRPEAANADAAPAFAAWRGEATDRRSARVALK